MKRNKSILIILCLYVSIIACNIPVQKTYTGISPILTATAQVRLISTSIPVDNIDRNHLNGEADYFTQSGDTLSALASRFQISEKEIVDQNPSISSLVESTTLEQGIPLQVKTQNETASRFSIHLIPNVYLIYGPTQMDFDVDDFVNQSTGWLKSYVDQSSGNAVSGLQILKGTAENYSISPRLLLALLEYHLQALSKSSTPASFYLGSEEPNRKTLGKQLSWAANKLNNGYYGWREGVQTQFTDSSGVTLLLNPRDNAASVALIYYFSQFMSGSELEQSLSPEGFLSTYQALFGEIDQNADRVNPLIPENLQQPELILPLQPGIKWALTGGPHSGWGIGFPYAAIDFAPPAETAGCDPSPYWAIAVADGIISRSDNGTLVLDLDGDGKSQTGWTIQYLHIAPYRTFSIGTLVQKGDPLGHPSCLGGNSSGRNLHIARLYNGEWIPSGGVIPLNLGGWVASYGEKEYKGSLTKLEISLKSSSSGEWFSQLVVEE
jgi:LasA protease